MTRPTGATDLECRAATGGRCADKTIPAESAIGRPVELEVRESLPRCRRFPAQPLALRRACSQCSVPNPIYIPRSRRSRHLVMGVTYGYAIAGYMHQ